MAGRQGCPVVNNRNKGRSPRFSTILRMLRTQSLGAATDSVPTTSSRSTVSGIRRALSVGLLAFCARPLLARAAPVANAKYDAACTSAKAVHDLRCPNYTGFKTQSPQDPQAARRQPHTKIRMGRPLQQGVASWYGPGFQGRRTASGERFDMHALTAAHRTLPFGTHVQVEHRGTGMTVTVRINDRGPFVGDRIIDLSKAAAQALDIVDDGHAVVVLREAVPQAT